MEEQKTNKISLLKKIWYSVTKFDKYPDMAVEGVKAAIKYLVILTAIVTVFSVINSMIEIGKMVENVATYIEENIPEFSYSDGNITMDIQEPIIISNIQYSGIDKIVINPNAETYEQKQETKQENNEDGTTIFFFKNQITLQSKLEGAEAQEKGYTYEEFIKSYTQDNIKDFNKAQVIEYMRSAQMTSFYYKYGVSITIYLFLANIMFAAFCTIELAVLGWITASVGRIRIKLKAILSMAMYSLTLPMILNIAYIVINYFTKFTISYFQVAYTTIAYVYLAAAIFILKDDFIKKQQEVEKIKQEQKKVREEILQQDKEPEKREENKSGKDEDQKEEKEDEGQEPKGSEA